MKNPYEKIEHHPSRVVFGGRSLYAVVIVFLLGLISVPLTRHLAEFQKEKEERWFPAVEFWKHPNQRSYNQLFDKKSKSSLVTRKEPNLRDHLQSFEAGIKESDLRKLVQKSEQTILSAFFNQGNRKVVKGRGGWLYYQAAVDAVTGLGPLKPETDSVTKDPDRPEWRAALPIIETFADQLNDRGIELMIVPIPVKTMVQTEGLGGKGIIKHPDQDAFYDALRSKGITVVDLLADFERAKEKGDIFLKQDTHWRSETAKMAAETVAREVKKRDWYSAAPKNLKPVYQKAERSATGDLADMLGLPLKDETQTIERILDPKTGQAVEGELQSPISIIGDSFVNIYEEPGLGFSKDGEKGLIGAGFASHLSAFLEMRPNVAAINGEGSTGVRQQFASLPDNIVRSKKLVIWAIAARDFLLSESAANRAGVLWRDVEFNPESEDTEPPEPTDSEYLILTAKLQKKSAIENPETTPYTEAIYSTIFDEIKVELGEYYDKEAYIFLWAFKDRKMLPTGKLEPGKRYRLKLVPMIKKPEISRKTQLDEYSTRFDLDRLFAVEVEPL